MRNYIFSNLLIYFYLCVVHVSSIYIKENAYKGISISISENVKEDDFNFAKLKSVLTKSSDFIYHATRKRSYFGEFVISLPSSWKGHPCEGDMIDRRKESEEVSQKADVHMTNTVQEPRLTTKHSRGCGFEGDRIDMPLEWLNENPIENLAHQFVQQWSIYRYGVFEEKPIREDSCYSAGKSWKPAGCYNIKVSSEPTLENGVPVCHLPSNFFEKKDLRSSLMFAVNSSKALDFCDGSSSFPHNPAMPTLHNTLCKGRTAWSVIENSLDFKYGRNLPLKADKLPKAPMFKCFRDEPVHIIFAIQNNTIDNLPVKDVPQIGSTLFEFLSNLAPENSRATLGTFSDEEDLNKPFDLDIRNFTELHRELQQRVKTERFIKKVCLSCGLQKALNATLDSSSSFPIVVLIAWKSAVVGEKDPSVLVESIRNHPKRVILHLILVEDTAEEDIPIEVIQAINSLGGLIYYLPKEKVLRASKLLVILSAVVKNPLQIEDRIAVVHEKIYRNISKNFVDSFITPSGEFKKMLYAMYCAPNDDIFIRSDNKMCTSLSAASTSDSTFKCGEVSVFRNNKEPKKIWEYPFSYFKTTDSLHCSSVALLQSSQSASPTDSFTLRGWLSDYVVKVPQHAVIIYVEITGFPKRKYQVMAQISGPGLKSPISLRLRDNGNGDPDTKAGDGIYSRYFTKFSEKGIYTVTVTAEMSTSNDNSFFAENQEQESRIRQSKTIGFFYVSDPLPDLDILPPNRVADLSVVSINHDDRTALLQWTAPGGDYDSGKAKEYEVYYTEDWKDLQDSMLSKIQSNMLNSSEMKSPKSSSQPERVAFYFPAQQEKSVYYVALRAVDISDNKGQLSNMVQIAFGVDKSPANVTDFNMTGEMTETSTDSIQKIISEDDFSRCYIILGVAIGVLLFIIIINIVVWLVCFQKYKKRWEELQNNSQQSATPLKSITDVKDKIPEDISPNPHSYTNPILEEYSMPRDSHELRQTQSFHQPATYALVEKKDKRNEERDNYPLRRADNINIRPDYSRHRESDLGLV